MCLHVVQVAGCQKSTFESLWRLVSPAWSPAVCQSSLKRPHSPPKYLAIEGWQDCVQSHQVGTHKEICVPQDVPSGCSEEAYNHLLEQVFGAREEEQKIRADKYYLSVAGYQDCLVDSCLPQQKPEQCSSTSWLLLSKFARGPTRCGATGPTGLREAGGAPQKLPDFIDSSFFVGNPSTITDQPHIPKKSCDRASDCSRSEKCHGGFRKFCVPAGQRCRTSNDCKPVGHLFEGQLSGFCSNGICTWSTAEIIS